MVVIISPFAKNNNSFFQLPMRKEKALPSGTPARCLNNGMDADAATALNALWEKPG